MRSAVAHLLERFDSAEDLDARQRSRQRSGQRELASGPPRWDHAELAGRLVEISGQGALSVAMGVVLHAQQVGEPVVWISAGGPLFYPPDVAEGGVDLDALIVVSVRGAEAAARAGDRLLRSGAFGLVILDFATQRGSSIQSRPLLQSGSSAQGYGLQVPMGLQARLVKLAQNHGAAVVALTEKPDHAPSLSSLVSLRCSVQRQWLADGRYRCQVRMLKDKRRGPSWSHEEELRTPPGLG